MRLAFSICALTMFVIAKRNQRACVLRAVDLFTLGALSIGIVVFWLSIVTSAEAFDVYRQSNHLSISGVIGEDSQRTFNQNLVEAILELALANDRESSIHLHLNLPKGGDASVSLKLVGIMRAAQSHGTKFVARVNSGSTCMSGCTFMFLAANERWMAPEARLIFHGFSQANPERPVEVPPGYRVAYSELLKSANLEFYRFFKMERIIEDDRKVGFTGKTLFEHKAFEGLIRGLLPKRP